MAGMRGRAALPGFGASRMLAAANYPLGLRAFDVKMAVYALSLLGHAGRLDPRFPRMGFELSGLVADPDLVEHAHQRQRRALG